MSHTVLSIRYHIVDMVIWYIHIECPSVMLTCAMANSTMARKTKVLQEIIQTSIAFIYETFGIPLVNVWPRVLTAKNVVIPRVTLSRSDYIPYDISDHIISWPYVMIHNLWIVLKMALSKSTDRFLAGDAVSLIQKPAMEIKTHIPDGKNAQIK